MSRAVLSIGSNMGDRLELLTSVRDDLADHLLAVSAVFSTPPWGPVAQDDFDNAVLVVDDPDRSPADWLDTGFALERAAQRTRETRWGPRTLDVDVITASVDGDVVVSDDPVLTLPHPRAHLRAFVLIPWLDADPDATLWTPDGVRAVTDLAAALDPADRDGVRRREVEAWSTTVRGVS
ncbi:2-amino-4-hydroxy-6-hydroxymethyldihydropteridine pyrophosphokinase [Williamsia sp. Leaf354]|jgi:2-amino-4-hydroxy-6-hydroxymethyldihydropteridine diphosphokinase|uniref:2-amino-4-hydroxy-6- hydroxymethyldihydropteridine diphosphokinase n=1 Tax=Williamsia sp. Leaf354 TaxID=1736349 RepID=UPI0006F29F38|nr:2-amino-4-hydroxy-6-hydroxymethyldihydropteridine diphosphokinase [Williamsia sp. Leaf354]KQR96423.1 2-amino-4-hydroxy-6-hydroxymethyldihydropteridine pyrophosphokinase [Williamsia sp. Leaf354]